MHLAHFCTPFVLRTDFVSCSKQFVSSCRTSVIYMTARVDLLWAVALQSAIQGGAKPKVRALPKRRSGSSQGPRHQLRKVPGLGIQQSSWRSTLLLYYLLVTFRLQHTRLWWVLPWLLRVLDPLQHLQSCTMRESCCLIIGCSELI